MEIRLNTKIISAGEDPHKLLEIARKNSDDEMIIHAEQKASVWYRNQIRQKFENDSSVISLLLRSNPAQNAFDELKNLLSSDILRIESNELFDSILKELLDELEVMRQKPSSLYLVDDEGKSSIAIKPEHIYQPPDFIDENGNLKKSKPIIHPGISVPLIMRRYESSVESKLTKSKNPKNNLALKHLSDQSLILNQTVEELQNSGIEVLSFDCESQMVEVELEFGHEQVDGILQSMNPNFHRAYAFSKALSRKIISEIGNNKKCDVISIETKKNSKKRWYVCRIRFESNG